MYTLGEFANMLNLHPKTLQKMDRRGVLIANRTVTNRRYYTDEHYKSYYKLHSTK